MELCLVYWPSSTTVFIGWILRRVVIPGRGRCMGDVTWCPVNSSVEWRHWDIRSITRPSYKGGGVTNSAYKGGGATSSAYIGGGVSWAAVGHARIFCRHFGAIWHDGNTGCAEWSAGGTMRGCWYPGWWETAGVGRVTWKHKFTVTRMSNKMHSYTSLCNKSPSVQGFVASLPVRLLFKYVKNNALCPVSSAQLKCRIAAMTKPDKMHCVVGI